MNLFQKIMRLPGRISALEGQVHRLQCAMDFIATSPNNAWLYANRMERMDANIPIFDEVRRRFHSVRYEFAASYVANKNVADIACGTGYGSHLLSEKGSAAKVTGIDIDAAAIDYAREKYGNKSVNFTCTAGDSTGFTDGSFDIITSFETIEHVANPREFLSEFKRMLKQHGRLIISTPNGWDDDNNPYHLQHFDFSQFKSVLEAFFQVEAIYNQNSGSMWSYNHRQKAGITLSTSENIHLAECFIAVCKKV